MPQNAFLRPFPRSTLLFRRAMGYYLNTIAVGGSAFAVATLGAARQGPDHPVATVGCLLMSTLAIAGGIALGRVGVKYVKDGFSQDKMPSCNLYVMSPVDLDLITETDWLYLLTTPHEAGITDWPRFLTAKRLGRLDKKIIAQILAKTPEKSIRLLVNSHLATIKPSRR